jgi:hypothetical protein
MTPARTPVVRAARLADPPAAAAVLAQALTIHPDERLLGRRGHVRVLPGHVRVSRSGHLGQSRSRRRCAHHRRPASHEHGRDSNRHKLVHHLPAHVDTTSASRTAAAMTSLGASRAQTDDAPVVAMSHTAGRPSLAHPPAVPRTRSGPSACSPSTTGASGPDRPPPHRGTRCPPTHEHLATVRHQCRSTPARNTAT